MRKAGRVSAAAIIACLVVELCVGLPYTWSILKTDLVEFFDWSIASANIVMSCMMFGFTIGVLTGGLLQDRLSPRPVAIAGCVLFGLCMASPAVLTKGTVGLLFVTYPLAGVGCGAAYASCLSCVQKWMPHRLGLASGLAIAAFGLATVVFSPLCSWLLNLPAFGDRAVPYTFVALGAVFLSVGIAAGIFIKLPPEGHAQTLGVVGLRGNTVKSYTLSESVRTGPFWILFTSQFFVYALWIVVMAIIKDLGIYKGLSNTAAVLTVSLTGVANACGRIFIASLGDRIGLKKTYALSTGMMMLCSLALIFIKGYAYSVIIILTTFFFGGLSTLNPAITTKTFGPRYSGRNFGCICLAGGVSTIIINVISSKIFERTGSYTPSFIMAAAMLVVPIIMMALLNRSTKKMIEKEVLLYNVQI